MNTIYIYAKRPIENEEGTTVGAGELITFEDRAQAHEAISNGDGVEINADLVNEYETKLNNKWDEYKKKIEAIRNSTDPAIANVPGKADFEVPKLKEEREKELRGLRREYELKRSAMLEDAKTTELLAVTQYSVTDEEQAKAFVERFEFDSVTDYDNAIQTFKATLDVMSVEQLAATASLIKRVISVIEQNDKHPQRQVYQIVNAIEYSKPVPVAKVIEMLPSAESLGINETIGRAIERSRDKDEGHTHTTLGRPSEKHVAEVYGQQSEEFTDVK